MGQLDELFGVTLAALWTPFYVAMVLLVGISIAIGERQAYRSLSSRHKDA